MRGSVHLILSNTKQDNDSFWHLLLHLSRPKLLPKDHVIRHPRLYGLPKYRFGEVRGNLRTTVVRRSVQLAFICPWRFSLALCRDCDLFAGSIVALVILWSERGVPCLRMLVCRNVLAQRPGFFLVESRGYLRCGLPTHQ